eukprot:3584636-Rhodomonas_salina.1
MSSLNAANAVGAVGSNGTLNHINISERRLCVAMLDVYCADTSRTRYEGQNWTRDMLKGKDAGNFTNLIKGKVTGVPTYDGPTWVLTYEESLVLLSFLPRKYARGYFQVINREFTRLRAGDQSLIPEIMARGTGTGLEAQLARSSVGLPLGVQVAVEETEGLEVFVLKRRREVVEVEMLELELVRGKMELKQDLERGRIEHVKLLRETFDQAFAKETLDDRDRMMLKDRLMNAFYCQGAQGVVTLAVTNGESGAAGDGGVGPVEYAITVSEMIERSGVKADHGDHIAVGRSHADGQVLPEGGRGLAAGDGEHAHADEKEGLGCVGGLEEGKGLETGWRLAGDAHAEVDVGVNGVWTPAGSHNKRVEVLGARGVGVIDVWTALGETLQGFMVGKADSG